MSRTCSNDNVQGGSQTSLKSNEEKCASIKLPQDIYYSYFALKHSRLWEKEWFTTKYKCLFGLLVFLSVAVQVIGVIGIFLSTSTMGDANEVSLDLYKEIVTNVSLEGRMHQNGTRIDNINSSSGAAPNFTTSDVVSKCLATLHVCVLILSHFVYGNSYHCEKLSVNFNENIIEYI